MSTVYRCKVRKPDDTIVDGCGFEFTPTIEGPLRFDGLKCTHCGMGFMRAKSERLVGMRPELGMGYTGAQIHGGPSLLQALGRFVRDQPSTDRMTALKAIHARVRALMVAAALDNIGGEGQTESEEASILECIALLRSLLPVTPEQDQQAQADMARDFGGTNAR